MSTGAQGDQNQRGLHFRHGPAKADLPDHAEHPEKMDAAPAKLEPDGIATIY